MSAIAIAGGGGRTILKANKNYYAATTGSDSNPGTLAQPWATLQHAMNFISGNIDFAGFITFVNIGSGSFAGLGIKSCVGGGILQFNGAGKTSTTVTAGPNDGTFNFGECFSSTVANTTVVGTNLLTYQPSNAFTGYAIFIYVADNIFHVGDATLVSLTSVEFDLSAGNVFAVGVQDLSFVDISINSGSGDISVKGGGSTGNELLEADFGAVITSSGTYTFVDAITFAPTVLIVNGTVDLDANYVNPGNVSGPKFAIRQGGVFTRDAVGGIPGTLVGSTIDASSSYNTIPGSNVNYQTPANAFNITLGNTNTQVILDPGGALASGTITMQPAPIDGQFVTIRSSQTITALTISANAGQTVVGAPTTIGIGGTANAIYKASNSTWYF